MFWRDLQACAMKQRNFLQSSFPRSLTGVSLGLSLDAHEGNIHGIPEATQAERNINSIKARWLE
jgi:hypothetical protein